MEFELLSRIVFITAIINIVFILLVLFSCRCINTWQFSSGLRRYSRVKKLFNWHCYGWYVLIPSALVHTVLGFWLLGIPF